MRSLGEHEISIEAEAQLYQEAHFHTDSPTPELVILAPSTRQKQKSKLSFAERTLCFKCGSFGHIASACTADLPSLLDLEKANFDILKSVISDQESTGRYIRDDYGLCIKDQTGVSLNTPSFANSRYCLNCGLHTHITSKCPRPSFIRIYRKIRDPLYDKDTQKAQNVFNKLWGK